MERPVLRRFWHSTATVLLSSLLSSAIAFSALPAPPVAARTNPAHLTQRMTALQNSNQRWIQINLSKQRLIAWEGNQAVYAIKVSTGKRSTPTRIGSYAIQTKRRKDRMRGRDYDVPNVPYAMYYQGGYAIHGAYWHNRFGTPVSHGCINLAVNHAKWLYNWAPVGTPVVIHR